MSRSLLLDLSSLYRRRDSRAGDHFRLPKENYRECCNTYLSIDEAQRQRGVFLASSCVAENFEAAGRHTIRYGPVVVLLWIGGRKFTAYEAEGISVFVSNSPLMSWAYQLFSKGQFSTMLGTVEILTAALIAARFYSARLSAVGSALAVGMFVTTLGFLFTTPGVVESSLGFPSLSAVPGQFLIKDVVLLGAAVWTLGEALRAVRR